jgi:hypothetical protein
VIQQRLKAHPVPVIPPVAFHIDARVPIIRIPADRSNMRMVDFPGSGCSLRVLQSDSRQDIGSVWEHPRPPFWTPNVPTRLDAPPILITIPRNHQIFTAVSNRFFHTMNVVGMRIENIEAIWRPAAYFTYMTVSFLF